MKPFWLGALAASSLLLSGCVAAAIPVAAAGMISKDQLRKRKAKTKSAWQAMVVPSAAAVPAAPPPPPKPTLESPAPAGMQFLYGSGEAAALSIQAYQALYNYLRMEAGFRRNKQEVSSVVLARGSTLAAPHFADCGTKPLAAVFDVDETVLLNLGYEARDALRTGPYEEARWGRWEMTGADQVVPAPGALETITAARREGITIVFNTNRSATNAAGTIAALTNAGLGPVTVGDTLWLKPDGGSGAKDERRWAISEKYCVVALVGDQLGDFSDLFNAEGTAPLTRRNAASQTMTAPLWGAGWFILPNPVYGTALKGSIGDIFPPEKRWTDPTEPPRP